MPTFRTSLANLELRSYEDPRQGTRTATTTDRAQMQILAPADRRWHDPDRRRCGLDAVAASYGSVIHQGADGENYLFEEPRPGLTERAR